ncbi:hypothetical protein FB45DRAFT_1029907 [Roridomyces roridus]|uniref:F-box domain-containing protein n=1 Tax=Roridomyces roridus TaxID=1738132 RepID=A0AAD7BMI5_9AGAR|nr:hypothetical protein FB45DRAFT_1029907 [Roridomyces roridus]
MPPKKRSRKDDAANDTNAVAAAADVPSGPRPPQNSPLFTLPLELHRAIASHLGAPIPYSTNARTAFVLSQTCQQLRTIFLPLLWECWNVCVKSRNGGVWYKALGDFLQRASEGLAKQPELLSYVRTVNVIVTRYSSRTVLPPFARCLTLMPNLHTLQIIHAHTKMTSHLKQGFEGITIPSVRKLILPAWAHEVLRCCPNVTDLRCNSSEAVKLVPAIAKCCKKIEIFEGYSPAGDAGYKKILKAAPNLKELELDSMPTAETFKTLSAFKKLGTIQIKVVHQEIPSIESGAISKVVTDPLLQPAIEAAKAFLFRQKLLGASPRLVLKHRIPYKLPPDNPGGWAPTYHKHVLEQIPVESG